MSKVITARYASKDQLKNAVDELVSTANVPREQMRVDDDKLELQVLMPDSTEVEVEELLKHHSPLEFRTADGRD